MVLSVLNILISFVLFRVGSFFDQKNNFESKDLFAHNTNSNFIRSDIL
jgi:hypothetical protein